MNIVSNLQEWQKIRTQLSGVKIGFVPTMGNLHDGHINLCRRARLENDIAVVSIFVNPTQFNQSSDFELYPRTIEEDKIKLADEKVDYLIFPQADEIYADQYNVVLTEKEISTELEGEFRPGHFDGMLTVVLKLFNLVQPTSAYFGEKDFQQLMLIKKMVSALFLPVDIVACETVRAKDGLALSSRNSRLTPKEREQAVHFPRLLSSDFSVEEIKKLLIALGFKVDYIAEKWGRRLGAVWVGDVRLIDNVLLVK